MTETVKLYHQDQYLKEFDGIVVELQTIQANKKAPKQLGIVFNKTCFYPTSGGQLNDIGTITAPSGEVFTVSDVIEDKHKVVHVLDEESTKNAEKLQIKVGDELNGKIDWKTRFDYMQQHHGQHILSATFIKLANMGTLSFHMSKETSYIDIDAPNGLPSEELLLQVQSTVNDAILAAKNVQVTFHTLEEAKQLNLRKLDLDVVQEPVRIVTVPEVDFQACCGTHPASSAEVGMLVITNVEKFKKNQARVSFLCGSRAVQFAYQGFKLVKHISALLLSPPTLKDSETAVTTVVENSNTYRKQVQELEKQLFTYQAAEIATRAGVKSAGKSIANVFCAKVAANTDFRVLKALSKEDAFGSKASAIALFSEATAPNSSIQFVVLGTEDLKEKNVDFRPVLKEAQKTFAGKGGGSALFIQGAFTQVKDFDAIVQDMKQKLEAL